MHPRFFLLLLLLFSGFLSAQQDVRFRRGVTVGVEFGLATDPSQVLSNYQPTARGAALLNSSEAFKNAIAFREQDSLSSYFTARPLDFGRGVRTARTLSRYNLQLHLTKKISSGLEFGGGLFLSSGRFAPGFADAAPTDTDFVFRTFNYNYLRTGLTGSLKFHFLQRFRLQPYLGVQTLFLYENRRNVQSTWRYPTEGYETSVDDTLIGNNSVFDFDIQLLAGLDYPLTERIIIGINAAFLGTVRSTYGGIRISWVVTDY